MRRTPDVFCRGLAERVAFAIEFTVDRVAGRVVRVSRRARRCVISSDVYEAIASQLVDTGYG